MPDFANIGNLRIPSKDQPLIILMSACLAGLNCGYDGTSYGNHPSAFQLLKYDNVKAVKFCPEYFSFGTP